MRKLLINSAILTALIGMSACGPADEDAARSNHIDSTNMYGTPPVEYNGDDPTDTASRYPATDDTGRRANTEAVEEGGHY